MKQSLRWDVFVCLPTVRARRGTLVRVLLWCSGLLWQHVGRKDLAIAEALEIVGGHRVRLFLPLEVVVEPAEEKRRQNISREPFHEKQLGVHNSLCHVEEGQTGFLCKHLLLFHCWIRVWQVSSEELFKNSHCFGKTERLAGAPRPVNLETTGSFSCCAADGRARPSAALPESQQFQTSDEW